MKISKRTELRIEKRIAATEFTFDEQETIELMNWCKEVYTGDMPPCIECPVYIYAYCAATGYHCPTFANYSEGVKE